MYRNTKLETRSVLDSRSLQDKISYNELGCWFYRVKPEVSRILLRIIALMALADGSISPEEETLIRTLLERYSLQRNLSVWDTNFPTSNDIGLLAVAILTTEERCLALKLAYMVSAVSRNSEEDDSVDAAEAEVYRQLCQSLGLPLETIQLLEKEAEAELPTRPNLWEILYREFGDLDFWPKTIAVSDRPGLPF